MSRRVLVTGGTGFVGAHLVRALVGRGDQVHVLVRRPGSATRLRLFGLEPQVMALEGTLQDRQSLFTALERSRPELVYHLGAYGVSSAEQDLGESLAVNVTGSADLVEAAAAAGAGRLVWVGTSFEYSASGTGPVDESMPTVPTSLYGATKQAGWLVAQALAAQRSLPMVTARCFTAYGPAERLSKLVPHVITKGLKGRAVGLTSGRQRRDYLYVSDLVQALVLMGERPGLDGRVINIGSGAAVEVLAIAEMILAALGRPELLEAGTRQPSRPEPEGSAADISLARDLLGWSPLQSLPDGLAETIAWYRAHQEDWELLQ